MADDARIEALRKRLQKDPGSIAFAQLAEEYRRAGRFQESIDVCRAGLARHPGYLSARVTLGRALLEVGDVESAERELNDVLRTAPDNLSAIRGIAEVHRRKGEIPEALEQFRSAFEMASPDPSIEQVVRDIRRDAMAADLRPSIGAAASRRLARRRRPRSAPSPASPSEPTTSGPRGGRWPTSSGGSRRCSPTAGPASTAPRLDIGPRVRDSPAHLWHCQSRTSWPPGMRACAPRWAARASTPSSSSTCPTSAT
ncbi:MAG: tetratricopeptide repeat protein [Desulfomicrobium escambiense]|nr:tetratricopeptide repeat protein [Desulfomicrobium escambiense]